VLQHGTVQFGHLRSASSLGRPGAKYVCTKSPAPALFRESLASTSLTTSFPCARPAAVRFVCRPASCRLSIVSTTTYRRLRLPLCRAYPNIRSLSLRASVVGVLLASSSSQTREGARGPIIRWPDAMALGSSLPGARRRQLLSCALAAPSTKPKARSAAHLIPGCSSLLASIRSELRRNPRLRLAHST